MTSKKNNKKRNDAAQSSSGGVPRDNNTPKELKAKGKLTKDPSNLNSAQRKVAESDPLSQARNNEKKAKDGNRGSNYDKNDDGKSRNSNYDKNDDGKSRNMYCGNKEKGGTSEMSEGVYKEDEKTEEGVGGMIFMCNAKTKADCFKYHVMGVSASRKDIVMGIKPGVKLFLFDFDLKLMYGIYEASSVGGMKLEPAAFGGAFPAQVRFRIVKDCLALPENVFKRAIKDNYDERTHKFKTELTSKQVKLLRILFRPALWLNPTSNHPVSELVIQPPSGAPLRSEDPFREHFYEMQYSRSKAGENISPYGHERQQHASHHVMPREVASKPLFLTEKEYRSHGLQSAKYLQPTASAVVDHTLDHYESEQGRQQLPRNPASVISDAPLAQKEPGYSEPLFPSEREYRTYGLKGRSELHATAAESSTRVISATPTNHGVSNQVRDSYNPYDESTASLVNRYLSLPRTVVPPAPESYSLTGRGSFASDPYSASDIRGQTGRFHIESERAYPPHAPHLPPDYGQRYHHVRDKPGGYSSTVSSRYSFAGPSAPRR